jgi:hypothetical protein
VVGNLRTVCLTLLVGTLAHAGSPASAAPIGDRFGIVEGEFLARQVTARRGMLNDVGDARRLIRGDIPRAGGAALQAYDAINFFDPQNGAGGHFDAAAHAFPGDSAADDQAFAVRVRGWVEIPAPGTYTFGVNSDDGFRMRLGPLFLRHRNPRSTDDSLATVDFPRAGRYRLFLTYFEQKNNAELELYGARGTYHSFAEGAPIPNQIIPPLFGPGPTLGGGPPRMGPGLGIGVGPVVPEPAGIVALATFALAVRLLSRARRRGPLRP